MIVVGSCKSCEPTEVPTIVGNGMCPNEIFIDLLALDTISAFCFRTGGWSSMPPIHTTISTAMSIEKVCHLRDNLRTVSCERTRMAGTGCALLTWYMMSFFTVSTPPCAF
ncbi:hypothetical protein Tco_0619896 [Tanacetum coccineum]